MSTWGDARDEFELTDVDDPVTRRFMKGLTGGGGGCEYSSSSSGGTSDERGDRRPTNILKDATSRLNLYNKSIRSSIHYLSSLTGGSSLQEGYLTSRHRE